MNVLFGGMGELLLLPQDQVSSCPPFPAGSSQSLAFGLGSTFPGNGTIWWPQGLDLCSGALWGLL